MFNITVSEYSGHDLVFMLDEDDGFWFIIRHTQSANHVTSVSFGECSSAINKAGGLNEFIYSKVISKANEKIEAFFGKAADPSVSEDWRANLERAVKKLTFSDGEIK